MQCPECGSAHSRKNGHRRGKQNHICVDCNRQFVDEYSERGSDWTKRLCLRMYVNGMRFRGIGRVMGGNHTIVMDWLTQVGECLPDADAPDEIPHVGELDELQTFVGRKKVKVWIWTAVDHFNPGILGWAIGDRSAKTFKPLWQSISFWNYFFWVSDGYTVYPMLIPDGAQIVST